jgi:hypothetical protein
VKPTPSSVALEQALEEIVAATRLAIDAVRAGETEALHSALDRREAAVSAALGLSSVSVSTPVVVLASEAERLAAELTSAVSNARDELGHEIVRTQHAGAGAVGYAEAPGPSTARLDLRR